MLVLGITDSHDASITLVEDGNVLLAVSEERFTRRKRQQGFPLETIKYAQKLINHRQLDKVYVSGRYGRSFFRVFNSIYSRTSAHQDLTAFSSKICSWLENRIAGSRYLRSIDLKLSSWVVKYRLKKAKVSFRLIEFIDHHHAHIRTATSGISSENYLALSLDAYGDGKSGLVVKFENGKILLEKEIDYRNSIAGFYGYICAAMGFQEGEEGKVMALADYGFPTGLVDLFQSLFKLNRGELTLSNNYRKKHFLKTLKCFRHQDIAFALQKTTEKIALNFISGFVEQDERSDLFLAGGFFANIKVIQRLNESNLFNRIFVFPNMGDGGLSFLADNFSGMYLGPDYKEEEICNVLKDKQLEYTFEPEIEKKIAFLLGQGKTVARFNGPMEFGPRALGNRSILYQANDPSVNHWLNRKLKRTEFMPFAPSTIFESKDLCYKNINGAQEAARFMTVSFECTDWMKKVSAGVVHIDGTARPQIVNFNDNPSYYMIIKEYCALTGIPSILNTSFNMHNEPIVCTPGDAISTFYEAGLDYLAIGKFLLKNNN